MDDDSSELRKRRHATAQSTRRRLVAHLAAGGTTDMAASVLENDRSVYTDPSRAERERALIFRNTWLLAGLSGDVPEPGDCLLFDQVGPSVLIVRGRDLRLRGFINMCRHRASMLVTRGKDGRCARRDRLSCPFHGWTYDLDGKLIGVPGSDGFERIEPGTRDLLPATVAEWHGLIFVRTGEQGEPHDAGAHLGRFAPEIEQLELGALVPIRSSRVAAETDWKLALDTYCEGYHFGVLHRSSIGLSHHSNVAVFDDFFPHWRIAFAERTLDELVGRPQSQWPDAVFGGVYFIFPSTVIVYGTLRSGDACVRVFRLFPGDRSGRTTCCITVYAPPAVAHDTERVAHEFAYDDAESEITQEDYKIAEEAYRNLLHAPQGFRLVYGRNEPALQAFHRAVAVHLGDASG